MQQDNTSAIPAEELTPQTTEDTQPTQDGAEPITSEESTSEADSTESQPKSEKIFGKYQTLEEAKKGYAHLTDRARRAEQELKALKAQQESKKYDDLGSLTYDEQVKFLADKLKEQEAFKAKLEEEMEAQSYEIQIAEDRKALEKFIAKNPILTDIGLDEEFRLIATHPDMVEFTFESIFEKKLKPKIEKIMGTKITVREKPLKGGINPSPRKSIDEMSLEEYEANRAEILKDPTQFNK